MRPICVTGPWESQTEKERDNKLLDPSGLRHAACLSHSESHISGTAAGLQSSVQFLPEEHRIPGLTVQPAVPFLFTTNKNANLHYF